MADSAKQFLVIDKDGKGHLPVRDSADGPLNHRLMGAAWAALHGGYRGNKYEGPGKEEAIRKLKELYKSEGMDLPSETASESFVIGPLSFAKDQGLRTKDGLPRFVWRLSDLGAGTARIGLAVTGTWVKNGEEFEITPEDLVLAAENFRKKLTGEINVDYDHASEMPEVAAGGPIPSAGRIVGIAGPEPYVDPGGTAREILWGEYEPTERAREMIRNREYRYISPAINWGARDKQTGKRQGTTLTSVALTNRPFLEELPQIRLSDPEFREVQQKETGNRKLETSDQLPACLRRQVSSFQFLAEGVTMKNLILKHVDGVHHVLDEDREVGVLADDHLRSYVEEHLKPNGDGNEKASELFAEFANLAGAVREPPLRAADKIRERLRLAEQAAEGSRAARAREELSRIYLADKPDEDAGDKLLASGVLTLLELRGAERARKRVDEAMAAGKILPVDRAVAFRTALTDPKTFHDWIMKRPARPLGAVGIAGSELEGANPRAQLAELVRRKKDELRAQRPSADERHLFHEATELVRKENPELFRRYREEKQ